MVASTYAASDAVVVLESKRLVAPKADERAVESRSLWTWDSSELESIYPDSDRLNTTSNETVKVDVVSNLPSAALLLVSPERSLLRSHSIAKLDTWPPAHTVDEFAIAL